MADNRNRVPSLKFFCARTIAFNRNKVGSTANLPLETKEYLENIEKDYFSIKNIECGTKNKFNNQSSKFVDYIKLMAIGRSDLCYLIYNLRTHDSFDLRESDFFWMDDYPKIRKIIKT